MQTHLNLAVALALSATLCTSAASSDSSPTVALLPPPPATCNDRPVNATDAELAACEALAKKPEDAAEALTNLCKMFNSRFRYDEAVSACNRAIALNPRNAEAWSSRARAYSSMSEFNNSIADISKAIALDRKPMHYILERAMAYKEKGDYDHLVPGRAAVSVMSYDRSIADGMRVKALARKLPADKQTVASVVADFADTTIDEARQAKARLATERKPADARRWCEGKELPNEKLSPYGDSYNVSVACTVLIKSGRVKGVALGEAHFHRAQARDKENYGIEEKWRGPMAIPDYKKAIALGAEVVRSSFSIGAIYAQYGEGEKALPYLDVAVAANGPGLAAALAARAQAHGQLGHYDAAMADFDRAVALKPGDPDALVARSLAYVTHRDYDLALADCEAAAKAKARFALVAWAHRVCGNAHYLKKNYAAAIVAYDAAEQTTGPSADISYARGIAKFRNGDVAGAQTDINQAFFMDSNAGTRAAKLGITP